MHPAIYTTHAPSNHIFFSIFPLDLQVKKKNKKFGIWLVAAMHLLIKLASLPTCYLEKLISGDNYMYLQ